MTGVVNDRLKTALTGRYAIERELGQGGMATVYLAEDLKHGRQVAVKVLKPELAAALGAERFLREITISAKLNHPHILPLYDSGEAGGFLYYVMPYVEGESLRERLGREKQLPIEDAVRIAREVADALSYAHSHGVVHRDIKPENILLESAHAVVADFGIARAITAAGGDTLTQTGMAIGTPAYMSPEQAAGQADLDGRSDLYSLGCVLYEMLAGQAPFTGPTAESLVHQHLAVEPHPITSLRPAVPAEVAAALHRALAKTPADRFNPVALFAESLRVTPAVAARPRRAVHLPPRRAWAVGAGLGAVALVAAVAALRLNARAGRVREALAVAMAAARAHRFDELYDGLRAADLDISDQRLASLLPVAAGNLSVTTDPAGATVEATRVHPIAGFAARAPLNLGMSPISARLLVAGEYVIRLRHQGRAPLSLVVTVSPGKVLGIARSLVLTADSTLAGMVLVDSGTTAAVPTSASVPPFSMGRYEITNEQFRAFFEAGAYRDSALWPQTMLIGGRRVPRQAALATFVDRTGGPGPRNWSRGMFADGDADRPVTGVSWYEAAAYARWAGKTLPSKAQWYRAAVGDGEGAYPWGNEAATAESRANFSLAGTRPVGSYPLGVSPFGCYDMAGNVREWLADSTAGGRRLVVGGSWQDPVYMFEPGHTELFDPDFSSTAVGFRVAGPGVWAATARGGGAR